MSNMSLKAFLLESILLVTLATPPGKTQLSVHCVGRVRNKLINLLTDVSRHKGQTSARICVSSFPNAELFHLGHSLASSGIILYQELVLALTDNPKFEQPNTRRKMDFDVGCALCLEQAKLCEHKQ